MQDRLFFSTNKVLFIDNINALFENINLLEITTAQMIDYESDVKVSAL